MKKFLTLLSIILVTAQATFAVEIPAVMKQSMAQDPIGMPAVLNLIVSMIVVIALIYVTGWIYAKLNLVNRNKLTGLAQSDKDAQRFVVLQSMPLGQQRYLYSIEMNGKILLVGATSGHINLIKEFDKNENNIAVSDIQEESINTQKDINIDELYKKYKN